jgi:hypothetical protein
MGWLKNMFSSGLVDSNNPQLKRFAQLGDESKNSDHSVIDQYIKSKNGTGEKPGQDGGSGLYDSTGSYHDFVYSPVSTNKLTRINSYRGMAEYAEVGNAVDEISEAMLNYDENGKIVNLIINNKSLSATERDEIQKEFDIFMDLYNLEQNFDEYARSFVVDGEIAFENIIDPEKPDDGFIATRLIDPTTFEFLVNVETFEKQGIYVFDNPSHANFDEFSNNIGELGNKKGQKTFNSKNNSNSTSDMYSQDGVSLHWNQITFIDTGAYDPSKLVIRPVLEKARKAYKQLTLIEDAILIYRLVRAPERLVFNVNTGTLPRARAEEEVKTMMQRFQTKQFYDPATGDVTNDYDAFQFLESYWFPKPEGSGGTEVSSIGNAQFWTELPDLDYFRSKLFESLKVPFSRYSDATVKFEKEGSLSYDEYRFSKFIVRLQNRFSAGFLEGFKNHLLLKKMWEQYGLIERDLKVKFTSPTSFELYEQQRLLKIKFENYDLVTNNHPEFAKTEAMRKYLGFTDIEIEQNRLSSEKEAVWEGYLEFKKGEVAKNGIIQEVTKLELPKEEEDQ